MAHDAPKATEPVRSSSATAGEGSETVVGRRRRRPRHRPGISSYLVATFGVTVVLLGGVLFTAASSAYNRDSRDALGAVQVTANQQATALSTQLGQLGESLSSIVDGAELARTDTRACSTSLAALSNLEHEQVGIAVLHAGGTVVCANQPRFEQAGAWARVLGSVGQVARSGHTLIAPGVANVVSGRPAVLIVVPIRGADPAAYFVATLSYAGLLPGPGSGFPANDTYLVLSADRSTIYSRSPSGPVGGPVTAVGLTRPLPAGSASVTDLEGARRVFREATVAGYGWHVLVGVAPNDVLGRAAAGRRRAIALGALTLATVVALGALLFRALARPVRRLHAAIEAAATDSTVRAALLGPAELAALAEAFNETVAQRHALEVQLSHQALHDPLTGLPNRALLADRLELALARQGRAGGTVAVMFIDLDRFKIINDSHGHPAGDQLLVAFASRLAGLLRPGDTVARFGGDEFVVVAEGLAQEPDVVGFAERLADALRQPFTLAGENVFLSGSVGVATSHDHESSDELIRNADAAMYFAKERERGGYAIYDDGMHTRVVSRLETERDLHRAISGKELVLHYQPKYSLARGELTGVEALVRWNHPTRGLISPADFIPIAEETGLIVPLGEWVLTAACRQAAAWRMEHGMPVAVAVNLSPRQLAQQTLPDLVAEILRAEGATPAHLTLEVTEGSLLADSRQTSARLAAIRHLGVRISIDDFGTGYSSLAYLRTLPLDEIKIEKSFVDDAADNLESRAILAGIVQLGRALGLSVVAEGVETQAQLEVLRDLGCDVAQGYHLGRPMPAKQVSALLGATHPMLRDRAVRTPPT